MPKLTCFRGKLGVAITSYPAAYPKGIERWRFFSVGRWCLMLFVSVRAWLFCRDNTVILSADSFAGLFAAGMTLAYRRAIRSMQGFSHRMVTNV